MTSHRTNSARRRSRVLVLLGALLTLALLSTPTASASYEQVGTFAGNPGEQHFLNSESWPEKVQLSGVGGMAVNYTGAGGVPAGTIYAATFSNNAEFLQIARYNPDGSFSEAWEVESQEVEELFGKYQRCGPDGEPAHPHCPATPGGDSGNRIDVDVDQTTGNVYAYLAPLGAGEGGFQEITIFSADGSKIVTRFGEKAEYGETIAATPAKLHEGWLGGIAVNAAGEVYVFDFTQGLENERRRLALFRPKTPGDYSEYVYAGLSSDIGAGEQGDPYPTLPVADAAGNIYTAFEGGKVEKYEPDKSASPVCSFSFKKGGIDSITVNPKTGEVFFYSYQDHKVHRLNPCDGEGNFHEAQAFGFAPQRKHLTAMALDPQRSFGPGRGAGVLYAGAPGGEGGGGGESSIGYVFAPPLELAPVIGPQSVSAVGSTSARLQATVNPKGNPARYSFQYLDEPAYQANEPDERQALTVAAGGGVFGLGFQGARLGGQARANLSAGSNLAGSLATATATATLSAAGGTGDLNGATGNGTVSSGLATITGASAELGSFEVGQGIAGPGIPNGTTITTVKPEGPFQELTISNPATASTAHASLSAGTTAITSLATAEGSFEAGQVIAGEGIASGTTIAAVKAGELTLSAPVRGPKAAVALKAGSTTLSALAPGIGSFEAGQAIEGEGIPANTTITAVGGASLTISKPATKAGSGVAISNPGPYPLALGEQVEGPGISPGTSIAAIEAGQLTLSAPATASGAGVLLRAGLPAAAPASQVQGALEALTTIGARGVQLSGGPGDEAGSSPYQITFTGALENTDVPLLLADSSGLSGGPATATPEAEHDGGGGFAGAAEVPLGGGLLEGTVSLPVADLLSGLTPASAYRYRAVATSHCSPDDEAKVCEGDGPTKRFATYAATTPGLPDHRAYELVSPPEKNGGQVFPADALIGSCGNVECKPGGAFQHFPMQSSPDGEAIVYEGDPFAAAAGALIENQYIARRSAGGWQSTNITPPTLQSKGGQGYKAFSTDLGAGVLEALIPSLSPQAPPEFVNLYTQLTADPLALEPLLTAEPPHRVSGAGAGALVLRYAGASSDLSKVFFSANDELEGLGAGGDKEEANLYEFSAGQLHLVNLGPGEETLPGAGFGSGGSGSSVFRSHYIVSSDGSHAFWSSATGQLYVRIDATETLEIPDAAKFLTASADGSRVLLSNGHLYDLETETTADLTQANGGFQGIAGQSEDLSRLYFTDTAVLDQTANHQGEEAQPGKPNLYSYSEGTTTYIATLLEKDNQNNDGPWATSPLRRLAEASPGGRFLAFVTKAPLTGYDNLGPCELIGETNTYINAPCEEVFLYDSATGELHCPSCNPAGAPPSGSSTLRIIRDVGGAPAQPRYLLDSGRLYFDSRDSLSPFDTNGRVEDVYQFEPEGIGGCTRPAGCLELISAGRSGDDSNFLAVDASARNVFFTSRDRLLAADRDSLTDLYDAREGGGIPEAGEAGECQGEACQPPLNPPNDPTPGSASFHGAGNVEEPTPAKCPKGRAGSAARGSEIAGGYERDRAKRDPLKKKHGKCVKKQSHKKHHRKKRANANQGGAK